MSLQLRLRSFAMPCSSICADLVFAWISQKQEMPERYSSYIHTTYNMVFSFTKNEKLRKLLEMGSRFTVVILP